MSLIRIWAMFKARNYEFFRDKAAFGWNFAFPILIIVGFGLIFSGKEHQRLKVGVFPMDNRTVSWQDSTVPEAFRNERSIDFIGFANQSLGEKKLRNHKVELLISSQSKEHTYWVNDSSPMGYMAEKTYLASFLTPGQTVAKKEIIKGQQIRYLDWLFPGILAMNMMFSSLWGVGFVVVQYRKNGALKRLKATPLTAFEYLFAQMMSRVFLLIFTLVIVWIGTDFIFHFKMLGSYLDLVVVFFLGCLSLTSIGLVLASRGTSEEFTSGALNVISWPMMFLSGVWFSLEGAPEWIIRFASIFPLTHLLTAVRSIMNDGATLLDVRFECITLLAMTLAALLLSAFLFSWND